MYLSQTYYPVETQLDGPQTGKRHFMLRRADIFMIVVIAWMTCFSFLRESYNDTASYISDFMYLSDPLDRFLKNNNLLEVGSNSLFQLYMSVVHNFTSNYHIFFFFPAIISSFVSVKFFKRYSANIAFSLLIFYSIGTYVMYIAAMKQSIAVGFLLLALPYAIDKNTLNIISLFLLQCYSIRMPLCSLWFRSFLENLGVKSHGFCLPQCWSLWPHMMWPSEL